MSRIGRLPIPVPSGVDVASHAHRFSGIAIVHSGIGVHVRIVLNIPGSYRLFSPCVSNCCLYKRG